ncbi:MAG: hypothetical protein Q9218_006927 [Villophora microphyllina]
MYQITCLCLLVLLSFLPIASTGPPPPNDPLPRLEYYKKRNFPPGSYREWSQKAEPKIGDDFKNDVLPHPNRFDQVYTALSDALQLILVVLETIDTDNAIYEHYFDRRDKDKVKAVFQRLAGACDTGNVDLSKLRITAIDTADPGCDGRTLAHTSYSNVPKPFIVICDLGFKKKAYTNLKGARDPENNPDHYLRCKEITDNGHVSVIMNGLGATLLHEYMHFERVLNDIYGKTIDDQMLTKTKTAYGSVAVYDNLNKKTLARLNVDSYVYYATQTFWTEVCGFKFQAPRPGIDDSDEDCDDSACHAA